VGDESESEKVRPVEMTELKNTARAIAAGGQHTCALTLDRVRCWGSNEYGQVGKKT
jgi:alpha-tubulin suppressor-like RCC1 family protein